jgi:hypothetical protein
MPHKFNANRRAKIPKQKQRLTNWAEYNEGLRRRGDLTVWISDEALGMWSAARRTTRGGRPRYSDLAIELCLTLGMVFKQPLRQTQGFMSDIAGILGLRSQCLKSLLPSTTVGWPCCLAAATASALPLFVPVSIPCHRPIPPT